MFCGIDFSSSDIRTQARSSAGLSAFDWKGRLPRSRAGPGCSPETSTGLGRFTATQCRVESQTGVAANRSSDFQTQGGPTSGPRIAKKLIIGIVGTVLNAQVFYTGPSHGSQRGPNSSPSGCLTLPIDSWPNAESRPSARSIFGRIGNAVIPICHSSSVPVMACARY